MTILHSHVRPDTYLFLRLPIETLKLVEIKLNTIIDVGKLGSFPSNLLLGRPYYHTYELLDKRHGEAYSRLRIVSQDELNAEAGLRESSFADLSEELAASNSAHGVPESHGPIAINRAAVAKNNRLTVDHANRQTLTHAEIEELKKTAGGREVIEKILASHTGLDEKTEYSKAKYMVRKRQKYLKRFTVLPMDLGNLVEYISEREPSRIMEIREESMGLITAWSNAHFSGKHYSEDDENAIHGRWLVVDDTGGLVVAAVAERMGILHAPSSDGADAVRHQQVQAGDENEPQTNGRPDIRKPARRDFPAPARSNTITLLHPAVQPNISLLKYFGYDASSPIMSHGENEHPLHTHLKQISWLQLVHPAEDPTYVEPEQVTEQVLASWKSGKRGTYFKKRRRWQRCKSIVDETRDGGFDGLVVASYMDPISVLKHTVPLIRGGGHVVMFSPTTEPLVDVVDLYSKERRTAYLNYMGKGELPDAGDFPLDPRLLLAPSIQTSRIREWQVLPGRTHPLMTGRGGPEGYIFTARKVIPVEGGVEARGNFNQKKRKLAAIELGVAATAATAAAAAAAAVKGVNEEPTGAPVGVTDIN